MSGKTALEWIHDFLADSITHKLKYTDVSIKEIADELGFPNISFFGKCGRLAFKEHPDLVEDSFEYAFEEMVEARIPGYVDFGLNCGYKFNRKWTLWLESGNLLCQTIQRTPFYAEKGPWVTAGISLNL